MVSTNTNRAADPPMVINLPDALAQYGNRKPTHDFAIFLDVPGEVGRVTRWQLDVHYRDEQHSLECPMCGGACQQLYAIGSQILVCGHCGEQPHE